MCRFKILGCPIDSIDMNQTVSRIKQYIINGQLCQHVVVNAAKLVVMQEDRELREIITSCDIINADGMAVVWAAKLLGHDIPERVAGVDLFYELIKVCGQKGYTPFFFGAREWVVREVCGRFKKQYPELDVVGFRNGYFSENEEEDIAKMIRDSGADMLFVGFSSPMKEKFLNRWMNFMQIPFCMGVGGSFDIVAGKTKRAPVFMRELGLEWLYRIIQEPGRMWKRYAKTNPAFIMLVLKELVKKVGKKT